MDPFFYFHDLVETRYGMAIALCNLPERLHARPYEREKVDNEL
jgi:hypothetical protein